MGDLSSVITSSLNQVVTETVSTMAGVAPIAITIFSLYFVWTKSIKFFKGVTK